MQYALVQFSDGRKLKYLVLTKDIKGFEPSNANDITGKEYLVKWQGSFDDSSGLHHDGFYPAKILLVGATAEEVRAKAKELKIRLPSSFPLPAREPVVEPMKKPLRKHRAKRVEEDPEEKVKRLRMEKTLNALGDPSDTPDVNHDVSDKNDNLGEAEAAPARMSKSNKTPDQTPWNEKGRSLLHRVNVKGNKKGWITNTSIPFVLKRKPVRSSTTTETLEQTPHNEMAGNLMSNEEEGVTHTDTSCVRTTPVLTSKSIKGSLAALEQTPKKKVITSLNIGSEEEAIMSVKDVMGTPKLEIEELEQNQDEQTPPLNSRKTSKLKKGKAKRDLIDSKSDSEDDFDFSGTDDDDDDATVLLEALKREHAVCSIQIERLKSQNRKYVNDLKTYKKEIAKKREALSALKSEVEELKELNLSWQRQHQKYLKGLKDDTSKPSSSQLSLKVSSPLSFQSSHKTFTSSSPSPLSPWKVSSPLSFQSSPFEKEILKKSPSHATKSSIKKDLFNDSNNGNNSSEDMEWEDSRPDSANVSEPKVVKSLKVENDLTPSNSRTVNNSDDTLEAISKRIEDDLRGKTPLDGDANRVFVGKGLYINRKAWEKCLRTKKDDSKFYKDCAGIIWGKEKLKLRTAQRTTSDKKPCTPKKVNILNAMLLGKMAARGESEQQKQFIIENFAGKWLTSKCYDSGRLPKPKVQQPSAKQD